MSNDPQPLSLEDKLYRTRYEPDRDHPHVVVDHATCEQCGKKVCVQICPAGVYKPDPNNDKRILVSHENCLECGTCLKVCPKDAIKWEYPEGGKGVKFRFG